MRYTLAILFAELAFNFAIAQERITETQVERQQTFIEANREKLLGNYDRAITLYGGVLKDDPRNHAAAYELARIYDLRSDWDEAVRYLKIATSNDPENEWYQKLLADVYQKAGNNKDAAAVYEALVKRDPANEYYYYKWAFFLLKSGDAAKAIKVYDDLESKVGINEEIVRRKHALYVGLGDEKKATRELERLVNAFPDNTDYRHLLAGYYEQTGDKNAAVKVYRDILVIDPRDPKANLAVAGADVSTNDDISYLRSLQTVFEQADVELDMKIGKLLPFVQKVADTGDKNLAAAALELTRTLERVHPDQAKAYAASGDLLFYIGQLPEALTKYEKTLQLDKSVYLVWEQMLRIQLAMRNYQGLYDYSEQTIDLFPNKALAYYLNGVAGRKLGQNADAIEVLDQAFLMAGNDSALKLDILVQLGQAHAALKHFDAADNAFEAALKIDPKSAQVLSLYSLYLADQPQRMDKAIEMATQAQKLAPDNPLAAHALGWTLVQRKSYAEAQKLLDKAMQGDQSTDPLLLEHYGDLYFNMNDPAKALNYYERAKEQGIRSEALEKKIKTLTGQ